MVLYAGREYKTLAQRIKCMIYLHMYICVYICMQSIPYKPFEVKETT